MQMFGGVCCRYNRSVIRLTVEAQAAANPEMRVSTDTDSALDSLAQQLERVTQVRQLIDLERF